MVGWGWRTGHRRGCYAGPGERTSQRAGSGGDRGSYLLLLYIYQSTGDTDCIQCGRGIPAILFFFLSLGACCRSDLCLVCWSSRGRPHSFLQKTIMLVSKKKKKTIMFPFISTMGCQDMQPCLPMAFLRLVIRNLWPCMHVSENHHHSPVKKKQKELLYFTYVNFHVTVLLC